MNVIIQSTSKNIEASIAFYSKLKFVKDQFKGRLFVKSEGLVIEINPDKFARNSIDIYVSKENISELISGKFNHETDDAYVLNSPSGVRVNLKKDIISIDKSNLESSVLGNYCGVSIETLNLSESLTFWTDLGFEKFMGDASQGWISLKNIEGYVISLMGINSCPHVFTNPSLTYFNGKKNLEIIDQIRNFNIPITEEITEFNKNGVVDNIVIRDPGGLGMFIFNDEV